MTDEISYYWDAGVGGDEVGVEPYIADKWAENYAILLTDGADDAGVIRNYLNDLVVASFGGGAVSVETGGAFVNGALYLNTTKKTFTLTTPSSDPRIDVIVIQKDWITGTIRLGVHEGTENVAPTAPTLTQIAGVLWEIPLANVQIETDNSLVATDARIYAVSPFTGGSEFGQAWELIETINPVGGTFPNLDFYFDNIPQTYKHLRVTGLLRGASVVGSGLDSAGFNFNTEVSPNYNKQFRSMQFGAGPPPVPVGAAATGGGGIGIISDFMPAGFVTETTMDFYDYRGAQNKIAVQNEDVIGGNTIGTNILISNEVILLKKNDVITRIEFITPTDGWKAGSKLNLWGLRG